MYNSCRQLAREETLAEREAQAREAEEAAAAELVQKARLRRDELRHRLDIQVTLKLR